MFIETELFFLLHQLEHLLPVPPSSRYVINHFSSIDQETCAQDLLCAGCSGTEMREPGSWEGVLEENQTGTQIISTCSGGTDVGVWEQQLLAGMLALS